MKVVRLEVFGFKSFMDRLILPLEAGITGVVGPNGCGKSNVVDALRWVLGETRASQLRGGTLEDVIFNGTDKLRPLGLAEVTLTLRADSSDIYTDLMGSLGIDSDGALTPIAAANVDTLPQETIQAEEENGVEEESKEETQEVQEVLNSAEATETEESVPSEPEPLGGEEGESASSSENTVQEASVKNPDEEKGLVLLSRYAWLRNVSELQITRRLYRSGESEFFINRVQSRLKDVRELFRALGLGARAHTIVAQGEVGRIVTAKPEERRLILEEAAGVLGFRDKIAEANRRLAETTVSISRLDDISKELGRQVNSLKRQAQRAKSRQEMKEELHSLEQKLFREILIGLDEREKEIVDAHHEFHQAEQVVSAALTDLTAEEEGLRESLSTTDARGDEFRMQIFKLKDEINAKARLATERKSKLQQLKALSQAKQTELRRLEERKNTLTQRQEDAQGTLAELHVQEAQINDELQNLEGNPEADLQEVSQEVEQYKVSLRKKEQELRDVRDKLISAQSTLHSVNEQIVSASPLTQLGRSLGSESLQSLPEQVGLFVDGLTVPEKYSKAVQAVLAERARFLLSNTPHAVGRHFIQFLTKGNPHQKKGMGIGVFKTGEADFGEPLEVPFPRVLDLVTVTPQCSLAAAQVFKHVHFAESVEEALEYFETHGHDQGIKDMVLVTADGDLVTPYSFYSLRHEGGLIQLRNRERELSSTVTSLQEQQSTLVAERESFQRKISDGERRQSEILRETQRRQALIRDLGRNQGNIRGRLLAEERLLEQVEQDLTKLGSQFEEAREQLEEIREREIEAQIECDALLDEGEDNKQQELLILQERLAGIDEERAENRQALQKILQQVQEARKKLEELHSRAAHMELELRKVELERASLKERILTEFGEEELVRVQQEVPDEERLDPTVKREFQERVQVLKSRLAKEAEVDPAVIEQYEVENARLEGLLTQKKDLEEAAQTIKESIGMLSQTSVERFLHTFEAVRGKFSELIPRLFGGGKGDLELIDPSNPLDSGVNVVVRPPGKKPKSIDILSGGEKALCATALIFAMFTQKPSPLCVLDEVDAPLDEANLLRYLSLIQEMSAKTQFLMITHNKQSMSVADHLVGVTMETPGASKIITVSLQEAQSQVA